jgi:hypothetical protein
MKLICEKKFSTLFACTFIQKKIKQLNDKNWVNHYLRMQHISLTLYL